MRPVTKLTAAVSGLGVAGLVWGFALSPGVAASFSDEATASASITVADALDCEEDGTGDGPGCEPTKQSPTITTTSEQDGDGGSTVTITVVVHGADGGDAPAGCVSLFNRDVASPWPQLGKGCDSIPEGRDSTFLFPGINFSEPGKHTIGVSYAPDDESPYLSRSSTHVITIFGAFEPEDREPDGEPGLSGKSGAETGEQGKSLTGSAGKTPGGKSLESPGEDPDKSSTDVGSVDGAESSEGAVTEGGAGRGGGDSGAGTGGGSGSDDDNGVTGNPQSDDSPGSADT